MSSSKAASGNRKTGITKTLRFKMTLSFESLFLATMTVCFAVVFFIDITWMNRNIDARLAFMFNEFGTEYFLGDEYEGPKKFINVSLIPDEVVNRVRASYPKTTFVSCAVAADGMTYHVPGLFDGSPYIFIVNIASDRVSAEKYSPGDRIKNIHAQLNDEFHGEFHDTVFTALVNSNRDAVLTSSKMPKNLSDAFLSFVKHERPNTVQNIKIGNDHYRLAWKRVFDGNIIVSGQWIDHAKRHEMLMIFAYSLLFLLIVGTLFIWIMSGRLVNTLSRITDATRDIRNGDFSKRVAHSNIGAEVDQLIDTFNEMAEHTENVISELRTISDNIAHDLKTPLTRLQGKAEISLYAKGEFHLAEDVAEECGGMLTMINTMLEITRTEYNIFPRQKDIVDFGQLAEGIVDLYSTVADDAGVSLSCNVPEQSRSFETSRVQMQRLFVNLIDNAIKFTPSDGEVKVSVSYPGNDSVEIAVSDTGCGMSEEDTKHIFDRFFRSDTSRNIAGNGLGLSLVLAIVNAHGGSIDVDSKLGEGSTFNVRFTF